MRRFKALFPLIVILSLSSVALRADNKDSLIAPEAVQYVDSHFQNIETIPVASRQSLYHLFSRLYKCGTNSALFDQMESFQLGFHAARKMPIFNKSGGVRFVILKPGQKITDLPEYAPYKGKKLREVYPDMADDAAGNRLEDDISAEGSHRMMVLSASDCKPSLHDEYHVPYHEFAHFIHLTALGPQDVAKIHNLYEGAKKRNLFLDDYAAENEFEYFAQGVEAYLSITKTNPSDVAWPYYKSTRADLISKDPDLANYIAALIDRCTL